MTNGFVIANPIAAMCVLTAIMAVSLIDLSVGMPALPFVHHIAYAIAIVSLLVAAFRGGFTSYTFWIPLIVAYPILTPGIVDVLGYEQFSARAIGYQVPEITRLPVLYGALATLFLSLALSCPSRYFPGKHEAGKERQGSIVLFFAGMVGMLFFAWLAEPGGVILSDRSYAELKAQRFAQLPFAGGAWVVFSALAITQYLKLSEECRNRFWRGLLKLSFVLVVIVVAVYLLAHARRSELGGLLLLMLVIWGGRASRWKLGVMFLVIGAAFSVVGYIRAIYEDPLESQLSRTYIHLPGGPGNVFIGFVVAHQLDRKETLVITPGETYLGHVMRLPPRFLEIERPETAYDLLDREEPLQGGEYFLTEPMINFGAAGISMFLVLLAGVCNKAARSIEGFLYEREKLWRTIIAACFLILMFRTLWYGIGPLIKTIIIAALVVIAIELWRTVTRVRVIPVR